MGLFVKRLNVASQETQTLLLSPRGPVYMQHRTHQLIRLQTSSCSPPPTSLPPARILDLWQFSLYFMQYISLWVKPPDLPDLGQGFWTEHNCLEFRSKSQVTQRLTWNHRHVSDPKFISVSADPESTVEPRLFLCSADKKNKFLAQTSERVKIIQ